MSACAIFCLSTDTSTLRFGRMLDKMDDIDPQLAIVLLGIVHQNFPNEKILDSSKLEEFADGNFKLDENGGAFLKE